MLNKMEMAVRRLSKGSATYVSGGCTLIAMFVLIADAMRRTIFDKPFQGTIDVVELILTWIVFPAFAYALITGAHVRMTLGVDRFPSKLRRGCEIFGNLTGMVFFGYVTVQAVPYFWESWLAKEIPMGPLPVPVWLGKFIFPIGGALIFAVFLLRLVRSLRPSLEVSEEEVKGVAERGF